MGATRQVWLWGAGRITRRRFAGLEAAGLELAGFIDVDPSKVGRRLAARPVRSPEQLPAPGAAFVVGGVGVRGARDLIRARLEARGYRHGRDFVLAA